MGENEAQLLLYTYETKLMYLAKLFKAKQWKNVKVLNLGGF
jgi:hypothetical protein